MKKKLLDKQKVESLQTYKALSHPLRIQILELLVVERKTVKQLAKALKMPATKLYYHVHLLNKEDLIEVVDTKIVSGIAEDHYRACAYHYEVDRKILKENNSIAGNILAATQKELGISLEENYINTSEEAERHETLLAGFETANLSPEEAKLFYQEFELLLAKFQEFPDYADEGSRKYILSYSLFPNSPRLDIKSEEDSNESS